MVKVAWDMLQAIFLLTQHFFPHCDGDLSRNSDQHFYFEVMYIMISWSPSEGEFKIPLVKSMRSTIPGPCIPSWSLPMPQFSPLKRRQQ